MSFSDSEITVTTSSSGSSMNCFPLFTEVSQGMSTLLRGISSFCAGVQDSVGYGH